MCNKLGMRKFNKIYGDEHLNRNLYLATITPRHPDYLWHISMARSGFDFHGEEYVKYKPGSAKHKHAIKLELYEDRALSLYYGDPQWQSNHRKNESKGK